MRHKQGAGCTGWHSSATKKRAGYTGVAANGVLPIRYKPLEYKKLNVSLWQQPVCARSPLMQQPVYTHSPPMQGPARWQPTGPRLPRISLTVRAAHRLRCSTCRCPTHAAVSRRAPQACAGLAAGDQGLGRLGLAERWQAASRASVYASTCLWAALTVPPLAHNLRALAAGQAAAVVDLGWLVRASTALPFHGWS